MSREIKYRVFEQNSKKMLQVQSMRLGENPVITSYSNLDDLESRFMPLLEKNTNPLHKFSEPLQYTGFKDYDSKEIYEGDILQYVYVRDSTQKIKVEVYFDIQIGAWATKTIFNQLSNLIFEQNNDDWKFSQNWNINKNQYVRVVGNIYENQELCK
jgi:uncharacterized phage protein (TIGR01671 family)